jgi:hypothetical protein
MPDKWYFRNGFQSGPLYRKFQQFKVMEKIANNLTELIGNTPLLELSRFEKQHKLKATIVAKLE